MHVHAQGCKHGDIYTNTRIRTAKTCLHGLVNAVSKQEATRPVAPFSAEIPVSYPQSQGSHVIMIDAVGVLIYAWVCKTREMREMGYGIRVSMLGSCSLP